MAGQKEEDDARWLREPAGQRWLARNRLKRRMARLIWRVNARLTLRRAFLKEEEPTPCP